MPFKFLVPKSRYRPYIDYIESVMDPIIKETIDQLEAHDRPKKKQRAFTLLHACAEISREPRFLRDELLTALFAGRDNTAMALTWTVYELARHPGVVEDLRQIIETTIGFTRQPTYDDLKGMKILSNMVSETLRLYPGVPFNTRACAKDTSLPCGGGIDGNDRIGVLAGTNIIFANHMLRESVPAQAIRFGYLVLCMADLFISELSPEAYPPVSDAFPPADEWCPQRWNTWVPKSWSYIPFHGGPRFCLGQQLALVEMSYVLVRIFQHYSRVELRMDEAGIVEKHDTEWLRKGSEPGLAERFMRDRPRMVAEIMLYPRGDIRVAFLK